MSLRCLPGQKPGFCFSGFRLLLFRKWVNASLADCNVVVYWLPGLNDRPGAPDSFIAWADSRDFGISVAVFLSIAFPLIRSIRVPDCARQRNLAFIFAWLLNNLFCKKQ